MKKRGKVGSLEEVWRCEGTECPDSPGTALGHLVTCVLSPQVGISHLGGSKPLDS